MGSPFKVKAEAGKDFKKAPPGAHVAVCVAVIDLGTHTKEYKGKKTTGRRVFVAWELTGEATRDIVGRDFLLNLSEKSNLRKWLKDWRGGSDLKDGEEFDVATLVGKKCQLTIEHKKSGERTYANISNISSVLKGVEVKPAEHAALVWTLDDGKEGQLPEWLPYLYGKTLRQHIEASHERSGRPIPADSVPAEDGEAGTGPYGAIPEDEIPW